MLRRREGFVFLDEMPTTTRTRQEGQLESIGMAAMASSELSAPPDGTRWQPRRVATKLCVPFVNQERFWRARSDLLGPKSKYVVGACVRTATV